MFGASGRPRSPGRRVPPRSRRATACRRTVAGRAGARCASSVAGPRHTPVRVGRVERRERVGRERGEDRVPSGRSARAAGARRSTVSVIALRAATTSWRTGEAPLTARSRLVCDFVAVPARVPELGAGRGREDRSREVPLCRVIDHDARDAAPAASRRSNHAPCLPAPDQTCEWLGQPARHPVPQPPRGRPHHHAIGPQQVPDLLGQDEPVEWPWTGARGRSAASRDAAVVVGGRLPEPFAPAAGRASP